MIEITYAEPTLLERLKLISEKHTKKQQREKLVEELKEQREELTEAIKKIDKLIAEVETAPNPFGFEDCVYFCSNMWSETGDVMNMCIQVTMQHKKTDTVKSEMTYKANREVERLNREGRLSVDEYAHYSAKGQEWETLIERMEREDEI